MMIRNQDGMLILSRMIKAIQDNKAYLGEIDGLIGDGDHGMNMNKGFSLFESRFSGKQLTFAEGLNELASILFNEIGGSMGPIYSTVFFAMAEHCPEDAITLTDFSDMMAAALNELYAIVEARPGDKTLVDTLSPVVNSLIEDDAKATRFAEALEHMKEAAEAGWQSTKDMVAVHGRSSRLGERSRGVLDAGATSCWLLIEAMADGMIACLTEEKRS